MIIFLYSLSSYYYYYIFSYQFFAKFLQMMNQEVVILAEYRTPIGLSFYLDNFVKKFQNSEVNSIK